MSADPLSAQPSGGHVPSQPSERRAWLIACSLALAGLAVLAAILSGAVGSSSEPLPPPVLVHEATPVPGAARPPAAGQGTIIARPTAAQQRLEATRVDGAPLAHISRSWMAGFYPIYSTAQATFGVNWLLLASIHMQETAFSTARGTYHGLNFAGCCGGPMQFNVTNGPVSTWDLVANSYIYARRPASYGHVTARHPSIYDDFDSIMAAAHLLSADGGGYGLEAGAWDAAYDYYGHDATGVLYADEVLARAIGWSQRGFCINCGVQPALLAAVHAAYGAPVAAALAAEEAVAARHRSGRAHRHAG